MHAMFTQRRRRNRPALIVAGLAALLVLGAPRGYAQDPQGPDAARRADAWLGGLTTLRAQFEQVLLDERNEPVDVQTGVLYLSRPDRFRWEYANPFADPDDPETPAVAMAIVADGERLWVYDSELAQATVKRLDGSLASNPAMLLSGQGSVADGFSVAGGYSAQGVDWVELSPREQDSDFQTVRLGFEGDELKMMELRDSLDQVTRITFSHPQRDLDLADSVFAFDVPAGVDVIGDDPLFDAALAAASKAGRASAELLQKALAIDSQRAAGLLAALRDAGVLGERDESGAYLVQTRTP